MVVYNLLCADLSPDFLDFIPGAIIEEKLLTLQDKLGENFPDIVLQYLCDDDNKIVQVKGNWEDIQNVHSVLELWMGGCENPIEANASGDFAEKVEGINDGDFFNKEENGDAIDSTKIKSEKQTDEIEGEFDQDGSNFDLDSDLPNGSKIEDEDTSHLTEGVDSKENVKKPARSPKKARPKPRIYRTPMKPKTESVASTVTRSGRVVKNTRHYVARDLYPDDDDLLTSGLQGIDTVSDLDESMNSSGTLKEMTIEDLQKAAEEASFDEIGDKANATFAGPTEPKMVNEKRGRKRKSLTKIPMHEVNDRVEEAAIAAENPNEIKCLLCDFKTNAKRHLKCHLVRCHVRGEYVCKICKIRSYSLEKDLRAHLKAHFPKLKCNQCDRRFPTKTLRDLHIHKFHELGEKKRIQKAEKSLVKKCDQCDHIAENERNLKDHVARHHGEKVFVCAVCSKGFGLKKDMVAHVKTHTEVYYCEECGKMLRSKGALKIHMDGIHRGIKKVVNKTVMCDHCGMTCRSATHYKEHVNRDHLHVKPFGCPLCPMAFYTNPSLKQHLLTHTEGKAHACQTCGKTFKHANSLRVHSISHLNYSERPYSCNICKKTFSQKGALIRHNRIHTGEKPYKCRLCDSAFTDYSILRRHMLGVHKVNSKDLCQRDDVKGNKGGPKPERVKVENIVDYKDMVREPKYGEEESRKMDISAQELALMKAHSSRMEHQMRGYKDRTHVRIAPADDKLNYTLDDSSHSASYVMHDHSLSREPNYVVAELGAHLTHDIHHPGAGYAVLQQNEPVNMAHDLGYPNIPFSVQHLTGNEGQNLSIQILQSSQDSAPFYIHGKT